MNLLLNKRITNNFSPKKIPGLVLWLDSKSFSSLSDGTSISQWDDLSGQSNHASQATGTKQPTKQTVTNNGKSFAVARFDGVDDWFNLGDVLDLGTNNHSMFAVASIVNTNAYAAIISKASQRWLPGRWALLQEPGDLMQAFYEINTGNAPFVRSASNSNDKRIWSAIINRTLLGEISIYNNGNVSSFGFTTESSNLNNTDRCKIGAYGNGDDSSEDLFLSGDISHILVYNRALSTSERQRVERWLSRQTGVTLA